MKYQPKQLSGWVLFEKNLPYQRAWALQDELFEKRRLHQVPDTLLLTEHPPVYTFGKSGKKEHLLIDEAEARRRGIEIFWIDRGGDITFHGPGQLVGYPIFDLHDHYLDVGRFLRDLEECLIRTLSDFKIRAGRIEGLTGVWVENKKVAAIGVKLSRWITKHGFALNVNTNLSYFSHIVPCGIPDKPVTSMQQLMGKELDMAAVIRQVIVHFEEIFSIKLTPVPLEQIAEGAVSPVLSMDHFTGWAG